MAKYKRIKIKMFDGHIPVNGKLIHNFGNWSLYERYENTATQDYWNLKLVAIGRAERKGNYWLAFDRKKNRFTGSRDVRTLKENNVVLHDELLNWLMAHRTLYTLGS